MQRVTPDAAINSRHELASELFLQVCDLPQAERARFLQQACGPDEDLRSEVLDLLRHDSTLAGIDRPIVDVSSAVAAMALEAQKPTTGARIGRYEILDVLGQGGMGTIYRARQENPDRIIALKVIRPGIASPSMIKRFELEARVLGRLHHPGIAQIHEAGTADAGAGAQPYFAMELVIGRSLLEYANQEELSTSRRLELIANICDAVHHAHQKGIIHRDLKPGNILVSESGQPKILDFGVARATDSDLKATTLHTTAGQLIGTIPYMSPEQLAGDPSEVDVRSDVYAIGVIAFELLSGRLPYDLSNRSMLEAARIVQHDPPLRLSETDRALRGDVETIIARALEKEKEQRYQSASELAADIRRYLSDEPIVARPPSVLYQMRKFARRNRALVAGGALGVAALIVAAGVSTGFAIHSHRAAQRESKQRQIAERTNGHLQRMLTLPDPHGHSPGLTVAQMLDLMTAQLNGQPELPEVEAELRSVIGKTYLNLRQSQQAVEQLQRAVDLWRQIDPEGEKLARALVPLGIARLHTGDPQASQDAYREAIPILDRLGGSDALEARGALLDMLLRLHKFEEAAPIARTMLDAARHDNDLVMTIARLRQLGKIQSGLKACEEGERLLKEARDLAAQQLPETHPIQIGVLLDISMTRAVRGDYPGALEASTDAFELTLRVGKPGSHDWKDSVTAQLQVLSALGRRQDMIDTLMRVRAAVIAALGEDDPLVHETDAKLAQLRGE